MEMRGVLFRGVKKFFLLNASGYDAMRSTDAHTVVPCAKRVRRAVTVPCDYAQVIRLSLPIFK